MSTPTMRRTQRRSRRSSSSWMRFRAGGCWCRSWAELGTHDANDNAAVATIIIPTAVSAQLLTSAPPLAVPSFGGHPDPGGPGGLRIPRLQVITVTSIAHSTAPQKLALDDSDQAGRLSATGLVQELGTPALPESGKSA